MNRFRVVLLFFAFAFPISAAPFPLSDSNGPKAVIEIGGTSPEETHAAAVLKQYLDAMTGGSFVAGGPGPDGSARIRVGGLDTLPEDLKRLLHAGVELPVFDTKNDASVIAARGNVLYLCGRTPRATGYAVNHLLHLLGVRFYSSAAVLRVIPKEKVLSVPEGDRYFEPCFSTRHIYAWTETKEDRERNREFLERNNFTSDIKGSSGHNFATVWPKKKYPELFPKTKLEDSVQVRVDTDLGTDPKALARRQAELEKKAKADAEKRRKELEKERLRNLEQDASMDALLDGADAPEFRSRAVAETVQEKLYEPYQVCVTNPLAWKLGAEYAERKIAEHPDDVVVTFGVNDGGGGDCMCPKCKALGNNADRYVFLINKIGETFFKKHPDKLLNIWAYANCSQIPHLKIDGFESGQDRVVVTVYEFFTLVPPRPLLEGWGRASHGLSCSLKWFFFHPQWGPQFLPYAVDFKKLQSDLIHKRKNNVRMIRLQTPVDGIRNGFNCWRFGRLLWEPEADTDAMAREYAEKLFPSASKEFYSLQTLFDDPSAGKKKDSRHAYFTKIASLLLQIHDRVSSSPEELARWRAFAVWFAVMVRPDETGYSGDFKRSQNEVLKNNRSFLGILNAVKPYEIFQYGVRAAHHKKTVRKYTDLRGKELTDAMSDPPCEMDFSDAALLEKLKSYGEIR